MALNTIEIHSYKSANGHITFCRHMMSVAFDTLFSFDLTYLKKSKNVCDGVWFVALPVVYYFLSSDCVRRPSLFTYVYPVMVLGLSL